MRVWQGLATGIVAYLVFMLVTAPAGLGAAPAVAAHAAEPRGEAALAGERKAMRAVDEMFEVDARAGARLEPGQGIARRLLARVERRQECVGLVLAQRDLVAGVRLPEVVADRVSADGSRKWLLRFADGNCIETLFIPEAERGTLFASDDEGRGLFNAVYEGLVTGSRTGGAVGIIALILLTGGAFGIVMATGSIDRALRRDRIERHAPAEESVRQQPTQYQVGVRDRRGLTTLVVGGGAGLGAG